MRDGASSHEHMSDRKSSHEHVILVIEHRITNTWLIPVIEYWLFMTKKSERTSCHEHMAKTCERTSSYEHMTYTSNIESWTHD